jgi:hypothetical protein
VVQCPFVSVCLFVRVCCFAPWATGARPLADSCEPRVRVPQRAADGSCLRDRMRHDDQVWAVELPLALEEPAAVPSTRSTRVVAPLHPKPKQRAHSTACAAPQASAGCAGRGRRLRRF